MASTLSVEPHPKHCGCGRVNALSETLPRWFLDTDEAVLALVQCLLRAHAVTLREHYPEGLMIPCHRTTSNRDKPYGCPNPSCPWEFPDKHGYRHHYRQTHIPYFAITCCGRAYGQKIQLLHHMSSHVSTDRIPCDVPGCEKTFKTSSHLNTHKKWVHPELCTEKPKAGLSSQPTRKARREETGPYPLPATHTPLRRIVKHVLSVPLSKVDAPVAATSPSAKPFNLSNMLPPWMAARPPATPMPALFSSLMSRRGSSAPSSAWSTGNVTDSHAPTSAWMDDELTPNVRPLSHHRAAPLQLPPIGSLEVDGGAAGSIQMSWRAYMLLYGSRTYS